MENKHIQESGEMYLENILVLKNELGQVRAIDIVKRTGYSKPSISRAVGLLKAEGMIAVDAKGYIELTDIGLARAEKIYGRHEILSKFFVSIGVDKETAASDACRIEHFISDATVDCIKKYIEK